MATLRAILFSSLDALAFRNPSPLSRRAFLLLSALHLIGLATVFRYFNLPIWFAFPTLLLLLALLVLVSRLTHHALRTTHCGIRITLLSPLFFLYAILAARFVYVRGFGGLVPGYFDDVPPEPHAVIFFIEPIAFASLAYSLILILFALARKRLHLTRAFAIAIFAASVAWASAEFIGHRARGATGSDPYAYVQMGVDLATRGTPLHNFPLYAANYQLSIAWYPYVHVGYHLPINSAGDAPTVWSIGGSFAYAVAFKIFGEEGLDWVNPIFSILVSGAIAFLVRELFSKFQSFDFAQDKLPTSNFQSPTSILQSLVSSLAAFLWLTSATVVAWAVVPMVDAQATCFSTLAIYFAMRCANTKGWQDSRAVRLPSAAGRLSDPEFILPILSGISLGLAYFIRHTQLLLAPAICVLILASNLPRATRVRALALAALAALIVALPDLLYHQLVFGDFLTPESRELDLFSLSTVSQTFFAFLDRFFAAYEFGWLAPFLFYGAYRLAREQHATFAALGLWVLGIGIFHLFYPALRLRDLLPEFPPLIIFTAYGIAALIQALLRGERALQKLATAFAIFCALWLPTLRVWDTLRLPFQPPRALFGYLNASQRAAFDRLAELTPPGAVIGVTLNSGAIDLYARRDAFRSADWNAAERAIFFRAMLNEKRVVFVLNDGTGQGGVIEELKKDFALRRVAILDVPLFGAVEGEAGALWEVMR